MKPILFHDIDGVLFGMYEGAFQLRPGVNSWLSWAHRMFDVIWLTAWSRESVAQLLEATYNRELSANLRYADWTNCEEKLVWLSSKRDLLLKDEWFWIDDDIPETDELDELGVDPRRCIKVDPIGAHELVRLQEVLTSKLENKSERVGR